jgi:oligoribonuclease NrnB/cAMP/cGMP phosphodiesterase (DHH superfamily)
MNTLCIYHNDADGRASAAIVRRALGSQIKLSEMQYGDTMPLEEVLVADHIIIVDFSLEKEDMLRLAQYHKLTWIDHHKSAINELADVAGDWPGVRDVNEAACVLTWKYYFPGKPTPYPIRLIGDRDIWRWSEQDTGAFNEGLYQMNTNPRNDKLWNSLLEGDAELVAQIIREGRVLREARLRGIQSATARYGYPVHFEGHSTLAINMRGSGDIGEHIRNHGYEIAYCYIDNPQDGELYTYVSLYSDCVDVAKIARRFGGGGHAGAAGFHFKRNASPFPPGAEVDFDDK